MFSNGSSDTIFGTIFIVSLDAIFVSLNMYLEKLMKGVIEGILIQPFGF